MIIFNPAAKKLQIIALFLVIIKVAYFQ